MREKLSSITGSTPILRLIKNTRDFLIQWHKYLKPKELITICNKKTVFGTRGALMSQFTILGIMGFSLRIHSFYEGEEEYHSHPRHFVSVGLVGSYREKLMSGFERIIKPGTFTFRKATDTHNVTPIKLPCITLALTTPVIRQWEKFNLKNSTYET